MARIARRHTHRGTSLEQRRAKLEFRFWAVRECLKIAREAVLLAAIIIALIEMLH